MKKFSFLLAALLLLAEGCYLYFPPDEPFTPTIAVIPDYEYGWFEGEWVPHYNGWY